MNAPRRSILSIVIYKCIWLLILSVTFKDLDVKIKSKSVESEKQEEMDGFIVMCYRGEVSPEAESNYAELAKTVEDSRRMEYGKNIAGYIKFNNKFR